MRSLGQDVDRKEDGDNPDEPFDFDGVFLDTLPANPPPDSHSDQDAPNRRNPDFKDPRPDLVPAKVVDRIEIQQDQEREKTGNNLVDRHHQHHQRYSQNSHSAGETGLANTLDYDSQAHKEPENCDGDTWLNELLEQKGLSKMGSIKHSGEY
jgi:hypothetical protein